MSFFRGGSSIFTTAKGTSSCSTSKITRLCLVARVLEKLFVGFVDVLGVTSVDDELFVLLDRDSDQVAVFSVNDYRLLRHFSLPGLERNSENDLTSCVRHRCLYASDHDNGRVHRYDLASSATSKWPVPGFPHGLSVTPSCNLLVTCSEPNKLVELSADSGQCVREIALQSGNGWPCHAVQLTTGQYVVTFRDRVCIVDNDGRVVVLTRSYGGQCGSGVFQLWVPRHLAVDEDSQFIFVADFFNDRVVVLSPTLEFVRYINERLSRPRRLHFHHARARFLFVLDDSRSFTRQVMMLLPHCLALLFLSLFCFACYYLFSYLYGLLTHYTKELGGRVLW